MANHRGRPSERGAGDHVELAGWVLQHPPKLLPQVGPGVEPTAEDERRAREPFTGDRSEREKRAYQREAERKRRIRADRRQRESYRARLGDDIPSSAKFRRMKDTDGERYRELAERYRAAGSGGGAGGCGGGGAYDPGGRRRRVEDRLRPEGEYIGKPGGRGRRGRHIRKVPADEYEPEGLFYELTEGGREREGTDYPGTLMELPGVGTIGLRRQAGEKPYTMDVNIEGIRIKEWKFVERNDYEADG